MSGFNLNTAEVEAEVDTVGRSYGPRDSGLGDYKVAMAYQRNADSGAIGIVLHLDDTNGVELRQTLWIQSGNAKGNKTYYTKDGKNHSLPGFALFNSLAVMTTGKKAQELDTEEKIIKLWSSEARAEVPTTVTVFPELLNQEILAGVIKQLVDKTALGDDNKYHPTGETKEENEIDKFFHKGTRMTITEADAGKTAGEFIDVWAAKWEGQVKDKTTKVANAPGPTAASPAFAAAGAAPAAAKPGSSIFTQSAA